MTHKNLLTIATGRALASLNKSERDLKELLSHSKKRLHDPFLYDSMDQLVDELHAIKQEQQKDPSKLVVIDTDYDTDGIMSAAVLSAALAIFNINYRVYIPTMSQGYGLNKEAVTEMIELFTDKKTSIIAILTADNGTNAIEGVEEALKHGIKTLVTDHHLGGDVYANASVIVNPNKKGDEYPFKGNAGAAVAFKAMTAYANKYQPESTHLIDQLIVFAGIANVADVMPITDENHYMVREAVKEINRLIKISDITTDHDNPYQDVMSTEYTNYNAVFHGLYDIIRLTQKDKDQARIEKGKKPVPLPKDEELIGWYLSPMMNAPRRIHATSRESMLALLEPRHHIRHSNIKAMITMNKEKSRLRNDVLDALKPEDYDNEGGNVLFVNAEHGISGLIAGSLAQKTNRATIVFATPTRLEQKVYTARDFDQKTDWSTWTISASARSNPTQPLDVIVDRIKESHPGLIKGGGGHALAAGYSIAYKDLELFSQVFDQTALEVRKQILKEEALAIKNGTLKPRPLNCVKLTFKDLPETLEYVPYNVTTSSRLDKEFSELLSFWSNLKPFGKDFEFETQFLLELNPMELSKAQFKFNPSFWKTFKFEINGVEVLTFDINLSDLIKSRMAENNPAVLTLKAQLKENTYRGVSKPQLVLST